MAIGKMARLGLCLCGIILASGCSPNWEELHKIADKQLEAAKEYNTAVQQVTAPPSGNAGSEAWLVYETRMATYQADMDEARPTLLPDFLAYLSRFEDRQLKALGLVSDWAQFGISEFRRGGGGGGNKVVFKGGNRKSGPEGSASGDTSFSDIYVTLDKANAAFDSSDFAQGDDAQFQDGDGTQGQVISRPNNQPNPSTEGGNINNNSEGLGLEGSLQ